MGEKVNSLKRSTLKKKVLFRNLYYFLKNRIFKIFFFLNRKSEDEWARRIELQGAIEDYDPKSARELNAYSIKRRYIFVKGYK